jgi:hypothetical protein
MFDAYTYAEDGEKFLDIFCADSRIKPIPAPQPICPPPKPTVGHPPKQMLSPVTSLGPPGQLDGISADHQ